MPPEHEDELDLEEALELQPLYHSRGARAPAYENKLWGAFEYEAPIPNTIHTLDCGAGCPGGLTEAQCARVVSRAIIVAIDLAQNAAVKVDQATVTGPLTAAAQKTAQVFKNFFGHDPRTELIFDGKKERSGVSIAKRFRSVAQELGPKGKRRLIFRCLPSRPSGISLMHHKEEQFSMKCSTYSTICWETVGAEPMLTAIRPSP